MSERIKEIRRRAQLPVSQYNDIAGRLVGDHLSVHVTRVFIALGISPTVATISMLLFGLAGGALIPFGGYFALAGFACIFCYYICDCVDGEVARFHGSEKLLWGFHDFLFHLYVKSAFFLGLGALAVRVTGEPWTFLFGVSGLIATLFTKHLDDVGVLVTCRQVLMRSREEHLIQLKGLMADGETPDSSASSDSAEQEAPPKAGYSPLGYVRAVLLNFDLSSLLYLGLAAIDLALPTFEVAGLRLSLTVCAIIGHGILLPLDYLDRMQTAIRRDEFGEKSRALLRRADAFHLDE